MNDLRPMLDGIQRQVHARPGSLDRIFERQRRRRARRRVAAGMMTLATAAASVLAVVLVLPHGERSILPISPAIDATNAGRLAVAWSERVEGTGASAPVVADGVLYVAGSDGKLHAIDAATGDVLWIGVTQVGTPTSPVVAQGRVFVHVGGSLYAFEEGCGTGGAECQPSWHATTGGGNIGTPIVVDGVVYVVAAPGGLSAFAVSCEATTTCAPLWLAPDAEGHVAHAPAASEGVIWDSSSHALSAFSEACGTAGATCEPLIQAVRPDGADLLSGPAVADGAVYVGASDGSLYAVSTSCASGGSCRPLWRGQTGGSIVGTPSVVGGRVYVASNDGGLYVFPTSCGTSGAGCDAIWIGRTGGPIRDQPVVSNGVVYVASTDGTLYGFAEACGTTDDCRPTFQLSLGDLPTRPAVWADRVVFTMSSDATLSAYTIDGEGP